MVTRARTRAFVGIVARTHPNGQAGSCARAHSPPLLCLLRQNNGNKLRALDRQTRQAGAGRRTQLNPRTSSHASLARLSLRALPFCARASFAALSRTFKPLSPLSMSFLSSPLPCCPFYHALQQHGSMQGAVMEDWRLVDGIIISRGRHSLIWEEDSDR